jgi:lipoprotein-anchoring transpeptidase ErfK/SrfK
MNRHVRTCTAVVALLGVWVLAAGCQPSEQAAAGHRPRRPPAAAAAGHDMVRPPDRSETSLVAQAVGERVAIYAGPGARSPRLSLANPQPSGAPLVFLVRQRRSGWLRVLLPIRPNGSTGWVRATDVSLRQHDFRIVVDLSGHRMSVFKGGQLIQHEPIAVGRSATPTPGGLYYIKEVIKTNDPDGPYGPYAFGLSGFSGVLHTFGKGDAVIGIHGTNAPWLLGRDVSHGCIRVSNQAITSLAKRLPLGVPVEITT